MLLFEKEASGTGHKRYYLRKVTKKKKKKKKKNKKKTKQKKQNKRKQKKPRYNITIYGRNFFDQLVRSKIKKYNEKLIKNAIDEGDNDTV